MWHSRWQHKIYSQWPPKYSLPLDVSPKTGSMFTIVNVCRFWFRHAAWNDERRIPPSTLHVQRSMSEDNRKDTPSVPHLFTPHHLPPVTPYTTLPFFPQQLTSSPRGDRRYSKIFLVLVSTSNTCFCRVDYSFETNVSCFEDIVYRYVPHLLSLSVSLRIHSLQH